ncbi:MAG TPA: hypothetical protein VJ853_15150, partial [Thermoanaerobaculia bacterium]|nr:hypothetical protein [Thermoanaerobaculia bacterium]
MIDRRFFLKSTGLALVAGGLIPNIFVKMANAATTKGKKTLVAIFQRGAVDGLNVVVPYAEKAYYDARPTIAIPRDAVLDLDGFFGLHPSMASLVPYIKDRSAAFIHAVGSPDSTRSHFDAQDFMESGTPGVKSTQDGFLSRAVVCKHEEQAAPLRAVALGTALPRILSGNARAIAMSNIAQFGIRGDAQLASQIESMYGKQFEAERVLKSADPVK